MQLSQMTHYAHPKMRICLCIMALFLSQADWSSLMMLCHPEPLWCLIHLLFSLCDNNRLQPKKMTILWIILRPVIPWHWLIVFKNLHVQSTVKRRVWAQNMLWRERHLIELILTNYISCIINNWKTMPHWDRTPPYEIGVPENHISNYIVTC